MTAHPIRLAHVVYRTRRFAAMLAWYRTVFDARIQYQDPALAFLTFDDEHHRFAFVDLDVVRGPGGDPDDRGSIGVDHVAWTHASPEALFDNYAELKAQGISPYWCVHHGVSLSMYYADPDGNQMEFQVDAFADQKAGSAYMRGPETAANPVGVEYDPDAWLARLRAGEPASALLAPMTDGAPSPIRGALAGTAA